MQVIHKPALLNRSSCDDLRNLAKNPDAIHDLTHDVKDRIVKYAIETEIIRRDGEHPAPGLERVTIVDDPN